MQRRRQRANLSRRFSRSSLAGGRPECLIRHEETCGMLKETTLSSCIFTTELVSGDNFFLVQLDVKKKRKKKDILFWGVCDVTVMQCNVWGQGADLVCVCVRVCARTQGDHLQQGHVVPGRKAENEERTLTGKKVVSLRAPSRRTWRWSNPNLRL